MTSEYNCVFGIATATPGLNPGDVHRTYVEGYSFLAVVGSEGRVWWFLFTKMSRKYSDSEIPRYNQKDIDEHVASYLSMPVTGSVLFSEIYKRAIFRNMLALEESLYKHWFYERMVCIGDSVHKVRLETIAVSLIPSNTFTDDSKHGPRSQLSHRECCNASQLPGGFEEVLFMQ